MPVFSSLVFRNPKHLSVVRQSTGFTLLEVMIALAILSVASAGLVTATGHYLRQSQLIEEKTVASWVADNWVNELRLSDRAPGEGLLKAQASMANREWDLEAQVTRTASPLLYRLEITVRQQNDDRPLSVQTTFLRAER